MEVAKAEEDRQRGDQNEKADHPANCREWSDEARKIGSWLQPGWLQAWSFEPEHQSSNATKW
jgi:hypothetical protein